MKAINRIFALVILGVVAIACVGVAFLYSTSGAGFVASVAFGLFRLFRS